jgi:hypothetical protein
MPDVKSSRSDLCRTHEHAYTRSLRDSHAQYHAYRDSQPGPYKDHRAYSGPHLNGNAKAFLNLVRDERLRH